MINRIDSIKNKEIILDTGRSIIGKILFVKDDLYVVFHRNESIYISKSKVKNIVDIKLLLPHKDKIAEKKY
ncbi:hypothetical protein [Clostridium sp. C8-1-8]|uniref:hypothetical protein n=1 Tax=Clostridium sp. C8-1-8 TaxID=2698831 RepID=UPI00137058BE|nr:hypothetical protein [Clostridium sp. C8-1-8]